MQTSKEYYSSIHRIGRISIAVIILISLGIPTVISIVYKSFPGFVSIITGSAGLLAVLIPISVSEVLSYTPVLGSSVYITFITGNILNLKLPVSINAQNITNTEGGTERGDVISTIAVSVSSLFTVLIIAAGVLLLVPLKPVLTSPGVQTAIKYILPALFGSLGLGVLGNRVAGGIIIKGRLLAGVIPAILVGILFFVSRGLVDHLAGMLILIFLPVTYFSAKFLYKKGVIKVFLPEDNEK